VKAPFALERYLVDLRDRTAWAPDYPIEQCGAPVLPRPALHRMAHLWAVALLDDRFDTLLLPILATASPLLEQLDGANRDRGWGLPRAFFEERLASGACLLFIDGPAHEAARWPRNRAFLAGPA
jgi:hypothetical protein